MRTRFYPLRLQILRFFAFSLILLKLIFTIIDTLTNYDKVFFNFNAFNEEWEFTLFNPRHPKLLLSILANIYLWLKFPSEHKRGSKHNLHSKVFKVALVISYWGEVLFETESKDILSLSSTVCSIIYEDLYDELFDKPQLLWFEILRLGLLLGFGKKIWTTILLLIRDIVFLFALSKLKEILIDKLHNANQQMDQQASTLSDFKKLIDEAPSAFFILKPSSELQIEFMNEEGRILGQEIAVPKKFNEETLGFLEKTTSKSRVFSQNDQETEQQAFSDYLNLTEDHPFIQALSAMAKNPREDAEYFSNISLSDPPVCYEGLLKVVEWHGQLRLMIELRRSSYQNINMIHELLEVCKLCTSSAEQKFGAVLSFVDAAKNSQDAESLRAISVLGLYKHSLADYIRLMDMFQGVLYSTVKEDRGEKVFVDGAKLELLCMKLGKLVEIINRNRMNAISITIAAMFKKGFSVNVSNLELLLQFLWTYIVASNTGNKFSMKIAAKQVNDAVFSLELAVEGFNSNSFCAEVFGAIFADDSQALLQQIIPKLSSFGPSLFMLHYLRKSMGLKWKCYGGTAIPSNSSIKTPNQFSRLAQFAVAQSDIGDFGVGSGGEPGVTCSLKLMALLEKGDLMSPEIDPKFKKVIYQYNPSVKVLADQKLKIVSDPRLGEHLVNRRTLVTLAPEIDALVKAARYGKSVKPVTLDTLAAQSYAEDFLSVAMKLSSKGIYPLDDQILTDPSLGSVEEDLLDWTLTVGAKLVQNESNSISPRAQLVSSEVVSTHGQKKKGDPIHKNNLFPNEAKYDELEEGSSKSSNNRELADKIVDLDARKVPSDAFLQIRSCETPVKTSSLGSKSKANTSNKNRYLRMSSKQRRKRD